MKRKLVTMILVALCLPQHSYAAVVNYGFTGIVTDVDSSISSAFSNGELIAGSFSVESNDPTVQSIRTVYDAFGLFLTIGDSYSLTGSEGSLIIGTGSSTGQSFTVSFSGIPNVSGEPVSGQLPGYFDIQLDWFGGGPFTSESLPDFVALDAVLFDRSNINFPSDSERLSFATTAVSVVPIPPSILLFIGGLIALYRLQGHKARGLNR